MSASVWNLSSQGAAVINIGHDGFFNGDDFGVGRLTLRDGAVINFDAGAGEFSLLEVGGAAGSVAQLYLSGGSVIDMNAGGDATGELYIGYNGATNAAVTINGPTSEIRHVDFVGIGFNAL